MSEKLTEGHYAIAYPDRIWNALCVSASVKMMLIDLVSCGVVK